MRLLAGTVTALLAVAGSSSQAPNVGAITGRVTLTTAVRGVPLASNVYQPRAVGRHEPGPGPEIQNVIVYLKGAAFQGVLPTARRVVEQRNETFAPRVTVVTRRSVVAFPNDDPYFHNVFSLSRAGTFDLGRYRQGQTREQRFAKPGLIKVFCHIHSLMSASTMVLAEGHRERLQEQRRRLTRLAHCASCTGSERSIDAVRPPCTSMVPLRSPTRSCQPTIVYLPAGTSGSVKLPSTRGTAKYGWSPLTGSVSACRWRTAITPPSQELTTSAFGDSRTSTMLALEGEYAFGYTRIPGELLHNRLESYEGAETAYAWFLQGMQSLTPRTFVAARQEGTSAPPLRTQVAPRGRTTFHTSEITFGYRIIPDLTARAIYMARKPFMRTTWDHQAGVSLV